MLIIAVQQVEDAVQRQITRETISLHIRRSSIRCRSDIVCNIGDVRQRILRQTGIFQSNGMVKPHLLQNFCVVQPCLLFQKGISTLCMAVTIASAMHHLANIVQQTAGRDFIQFCSHSSASSLLFEGRPYPSLS